MKVSELTGALLDYWVAKAEGYTRKPNHGSCSLFDKDGTELFIHPDDWHPSTDWSQGGPIIERELIDIAWQALSWFAEHPIDDRGAFGPTPLIAAMRAYVASKYGVEVPDNSA